MAPRLPLVQMQLLALWLTLFKRTLGTLQGLLLGDSSVGVGSLHEGMAVLPDWGCGTWAVVGQTLELVQRVECSQYTLQQ